MIDAKVATAFDRKPSRSAKPLCFIMDEDFAFRQDLAKELRRQDIDVVEFSNSSGFIDTIDDQNPEIVLVNLNSAAPHECVRALSALKECRFSNRPFGVKRFQTVHHYSVDVAHGLVLLFGIGTKALPSWDSKTRRNNL